MLVSLAFLGLFSLGFVLLYGLVQQITPSRGQALPTVVAGAALTIMGLYAVHFLSSFLALFLSVGAISAEIDSGTLHAVLARPIRRADFLVGRWLGLAGLTCLYVIVMSAALLLVARLVAGYEPTDGARAIGLMALGALALLTLSLLGSTLLSTLANGVVVFSAFGLAWLAGVIEFVGGMIDNGTMVNLGIAVSLLVPSDAIWRGASFYVQSPAFLLATGMGGVRGTFPFASSSPPTAPFVIWSALYAAILLALAVRAFARRDL